MKSQSMASLALGLLLAGATGALGQQASSETQAVLSMLEEQGLVVHGEFEVPGGLRAFAVSAGGQVLSAYVTPGNDYAIVGTIVNANGDDVAAAKLEELTRVPIEGAVWQKLEDATWVRDGNENANRIVYTFTDPNCPFCNRFWQASRPWVDAGAVQLRHIMVGVIRPDSPLKAAAILESDEPEQALSFNEMNNAEGGIDPLQQMSSETTASLDANTRLMTELGFQGTPAIVFRNGEGRLETQSGMPDDAGMVEVLGPR